MNLPSFTQAVPDNGYRWWYLDAVSDDGVHALTVIAFIGSVFSPYYARARKKGRQQPAMQHCSVNVALYGPVSRWSMTERNHRSVSTSSDALCIGNSKLSVSADHMQVDIDEITVPIPSRLRGSLSIVLPDYALQTHALDHEIESQALHFWQPVAPQTRITVDMKKPDLKWQGAAYVDSNHGSVPLEHSFNEWTWSRSHGPGRHTTVLYDVTGTDGRKRQHSMVFNDHGDLAECEAPLVHSLGATRYFRIPRTTRTAPGVTVNNIQTLEDTPFYSRSRFIEQHGSHSQITMHESLDLQRFDSAWVRCLLPFRMPRTTRAVVPVPLSARAAAALSQDRYHQ